ncbi:MAG: formylglycine-generating enzyme family protein [Planctomycetota bacterium]
MRPSLTIVVALLLAALLASCSDGDPDAEPPRAVEKPASPDDPPPHLVAKYGPPPVGGPTGRRKTVEGIEFIELKPGYFLMGSEEHECQKPEHWVEIAYSFWIARTEVTNQTYERFDSLHRRMDVSPSEAHPAVNMTIDDASRFCEWLTSRDEGEFRLPSEAEWEFSCRSGAQGRFCFGDADDRLAEFGWFNGNSGGTLHPVMTKLPNAWGLCDMHGNAWEWCGDEWHDDYEGAPNDGSTWASGKPGTVVLRGGGWEVFPTACLSTTRMWVFADRLPHSMRRAVGFRPVAIFPE